jgi:hypothetical protein
MPTTQNNEENSQWEHAGRISQRKTVLSNARAHAKAGSTQNVQE